MECDRAREAISARIDGEDPGVPGGALEAHLAGCDACRNWQQRAHVVGHDWGALALMHAAALMPPR